MWSLGGLLWPAIVEVASKGHPYRVARLLYLYLDFQFLVLPFGEEYRAYRRKLRPLRATHRKLLILLFTLLICGTVLDLVVLPD